MKKTILNFHFDYLNPRFSDAFWIKEAGWDPALVTHFGLNEVGWGTGWFFMVFHGSRLFFLWFQVGFHGFSWFQVGFYGFSWALEASIGGHYNNH